MSAAAAPIKRRGRGGLRLIIALVIILLIVGGLGFGLKYPSGFKDTHLQRL